MSNSLRRPNWKQCSIVNREEGNHLISQKEIMDDCLAVRWLVFFIINALSSARYIVTYYFYFN